MLFLNKKTRRLIIEAVTACKSFNPDDCFHKIDGEVATEDSKSIRAFMEWSFKENLEYDMGKVSCVFEKFLSSGATDKHSEPESVHTIEPTYLFESKTIH